MDPIEDFFKENKNQFNYIEPDDNSWEQLEGHLSKPPKVVRHFALWQKVAAVLVLGLLIGNLYFPKDQKEIAAPVGLQESMVFPDLALRNPNGETIPLSSLKGKLVLVEFWASYCMMCTEEHCYYFKPLYNTYKDHGFEIYSVSVDSSATNWLQVIERDQLDWVQVSDLMGTASPVNERFEVNALPTNYLLDQDGRVIAKNIRVEELEQTISSLLAYQ